MDDTFASLLAVQTTNVQRRRTKEIRTETRLCSATRVLLT